MSTAAPNPPPDGAPGSLELTIRFELGAASLSLQELRALQPGFVFSLPASAQAPVSAHVNGVVIGRGDLVRLGDTIGVRLLEVVDHER